MEAGLQARKTLDDVVARERPLTEPEFALRRRARENDVRETLDLLAERRIGTIPDTRGAVIASPGDRDQHVVLRPGALLVDLLQFVERDLELGRSVRERGPAVGN